MTRIGLRHLASQQFSKRIATCLLVALSICMILPRVVQASIMISVLMIRSLPPMLTFEGTIKFGSPVPDAFRKKVIEGEIIVICMD